MKIKINDKEIKCLFTCYHVISEEDLKNEISVDIYFGSKKKEHYRNFQLKNNKRFMRAFRKEDVTVIEIIDDDRILSDKYLVPNLNCIDKNIYSYNNLCLGGYPGNHKERCVSSGKITRIKENTFYHNIDTRPGSSGSPIINDKGHVIGIHTSGKEAFDENKGIFIGKIFDILKIDGGKNNKDNMDKQEPSKDIILQNPYPLYSLNSSPRTPQNLTSSQNPSPQSPPLILSQPKPYIEVSLSQSPVEVSPSPSPVVLSPSPSPFVVQYSQPPVVVQYSPPPVVVLSSPSPPLIISLPYVAPTIQPLYLNSIIPQQNASYLVMNVAQNQQIVNINNY